MSLVRTSRCVMPSSGAIHTFLRSGDWGILRPTVAMYIPEKQGMQREARGPITRGHNQGAHHEAFESIFLSSHSMEPNRERSRNRSRSQTATGATTVGAGCSAASRVSIYSTGARVAVARSFLGPDFRGILCGIGLSASCRMTRLSPPAVPTT